MCQASRCRSLLAILRTDRDIMNRIIYIVGLVVIVVFILGFFGFR